MELELRVYNKMCLHGKLVVLTCLVFGQYIQNYIICYMTRVFLKFAYMELDVFESKSQVFQDCIF